MKIRVKSLKMSFEQNVENVLSIDESRIESLRESGCVTLHERDRNINRQNQVKKKSFAQIFNSLKHYDYTPYCSLHANIT